MADEAFDALWRTRAGPELVALHGLFGGATISVDQLRTLLALSSDEVRDALICAQRVGIIEAPGERVQFLAFAPGSSQQGRLEWCLESHQAELETVTRRLRTQMLVRYLSAPQVSS